MTNEEYQNIYRELREGILLHVNRLYWQLIQEMTLEEDNMSSYSSRDNKIRYFREKSSEANSHIEHIKLIIDDVMRGLENEIKGDEDE